MRTLIWLPVLKGKHSAKSFYLTDQEARFSTPNNLNGNSQSKIGLKSILENSTLSSPLVLAI